MFSFFECINPSLSDKESILKATRDMTQQYELSLEKYKKKNVEEASKPYNRFSEYLAARELIVLFCEYIIGTDEPLDNLEIAFSNFKLKPEYTEYVARLKAHRDSIRGQSPSVSPLLRDTTFLDDTIRVLQSDFNLQRLIAIGDVAGFGSVDESELKAGQKLIAKALMAKDLHLLYERGGSFTDESLSQDGAKALEELINRYRTRGDYKQHLPRMNDGVTSGGAVKKARKSLEKVFARAQKSIEQSMAQEAEVRQQRTP